jgi:hypothetical protein
MAEHIAHLNFLLLSWVASWRRNSAGVRHEILQI